MSTPYNNNGSHGSHTPHGQVVRNNWSLVLLYVALAVIAFMAFQKGCNRNPYELCTFTRYSFNDSDVRKDNVIRVYDEDSVMYIYDERIPLQKVQEQVLDRQSDYTQAQYLSLSVNGDTTYVGIESKRGFIISITVEKPDTVNIGFTTLESYYN